MLHTADHPAFADTEFASNVSLLPLGLTDAPPKTHPEPAATAEPRNNLRFSFTQEPRPVGQQRLREAVAAAYRNGKSDGRDEREREGWTSAVGWGMFVGAFGTGLVCALIIIGLVLHAGRHAPLF